jgi:hypothetical protein
MPRFKRTAHRVSLTAMFASMSLLFLYLASVLPTARLAMYFLSSVFIMGLILEEEIGLAFLMYVAVSLMGLLLMPGGLVFMLPYALFFGHYGIGKYYLEMRIKDKIIRYILKLLYYNVALALMYLLVSVTVTGTLDALDATVGTALASLPIWALIPILEVAFVLYDYLFTKVVAYYFNNIRRFLMKD